MSVQENEHANTSVRIEKGNIYLDRNLYALFFSGNETIALLRKETGFLILPVRNQANGGRLMKVRNSLGDRVVTATDFLADCGVVYDLEMICAAAWDANLCALYIELKV